MGPHVRAGPRDDDDEWEDVADGEGSEDGNENENNESSDEAEEDYSDSELPEEMPPKKRFRFDDHAVPANPPASGSAPAPPSDASTSAPVDPAPSTSNRGVLQPLSSNIPRFRDAGNASKDLHAPKVFVNNTVAIEEPTAKNGMDFVKFTWLYRK